MKRLFVCLLTLCVLLIVPASAGVLYTNDPLNGYPNDPINGGFGPPGSPGGGDGFTINYGFSVSDSFTLSSAATVTGFDFVSWNGASDVTTAVDWSIGSAAYGSAFSGTATGAFLSNVQYLGADLYGYNVYTNTATGLSVPLAAGTYWLTLQNAVANGIPNGDEGSNHVYWDENDGPSAAFANTVGSLVNGSGSNGTCANGAAVPEPGCTGSETFDIVGSTVPEPGSLGLLGCGILALAGLLRRKIG